MSPVLYLFIALALSAVVFVYLRFRQISSQRDKALDEMSEYQSRVFNLEKQLENAEKERLQLGEENGRLKTEKAGELESLRHFRDLVEETEEFLFELDTDGRFLYTNPIMQRRLGYDADELKQRHFYSFLLPDKAPEVKEFYREQYLSRTRGTYAEWEALNRFGEPLFIGIRVNMTFNPEGRLESIMGSARDLSIQRALRKKNELFEEKLEPFFQGISEPVIFVEKASNLDEALIRWANNAFGQLLELDLHRIQTMRLGEISLMLRGLVAEKLEMPEKRIVWQPKPDKKIWYKLLTWQSNDILGIFLIDISTDETARQREEFQHAVLVSALNATDLEISLLDPEEHYAFSNHSFTNHSLFGDLALGKTEEERAKSSNQNLERALFWKSKLDEVRLTGSRIRFEESSETSDSLIRMVSREILPFPWPNVEKSGFMFLGQDVSSRSVLDFQQLEARDKLFFYWRSHFQQDPGNPQEATDDSICSTYFSEPMVPGSPLDCFGEIRFVHYFPFTSEQLYDFQRSLESAWKGRLTFVHPPSYSESGVFYFPSILISEVLQYLSSQNLPLLAELKFSGSQETETGFQFSLSADIPANWKTLPEAPLEFATWLFKECGFKVENRPDSLLVLGRILWANKPDPDRLNLPIPILKGKRILTGPTVQRRVSFYMEELALHGADIQGTKSIFGINKLLGDGGFQLLVWWGDIENDWKEIDLNLLKIHGIQVLVYADRTNLLGTDLPYILKSPPSSFKVAVEDAWRYSGSGKSLSPSGSKKPIQLRFDKILEITEGDKGFLQSLFESYFVSLEECQASFEKHLLQSDAEALKFLLHKVRATIKTFEIRELDLLLREAIEAVENQTLRNSKDRNRFVEQMSVLCQQAKSALTTFARNQGILMRGLSRTDSV